MGLNELMIALSTFRQTRTPSTKLVRASNCKTYIIAIVCILHRTFLFLSSCVRLLDLGSDGGSNCRYILSPLVLQSLALLGTCLLSD